MGQVHLLGYIDADTVNYKKISWVLEFPYCTMKCGAEFCQNAALINTTNHAVDVCGLLEQYMYDKISHAIVMQGLEPFDSFDEVYDIVSTLRNRYDCKDDIVIYTGYYRREIEQQVGKLAQFPNIIIKFGRYIPGQKPHYDPVLGVELASDNQYAEVIS